VAKHRIQIDFSRDASGERTVDQDLAALDVPEGWFLQELARLSDDDILDLFTADEGDRAAGPEGRWGLLDLDPYWVVCQLQMTDPFTWRTGTGQGWLKINRLYRRTGTAAAVEELRRLEDETERRWRAEHEG
jgi:hypothetical protein